MLGKSWEGTPGSALRNEQRRTPVVPVTHITHSPVTHIYYRYFIQYTKYVLSVQYRYYRCPVSDVVF